MLFLSDKFRRLHVKVKMKKCAIFLRLFSIFFNLCIINGHTLANIELNNITDVYQVNEENSTISITHPKDARPTLREIVYFHIIEKPYDLDEDDLDDQVSIKTPDLDKTRSFTNGHGYQYLNEGNDSDDAIIDDESDDSKQIHEENDGAAESDEYKDAIPETITITSTQPSINNNNDGIANNVNNDGFANDVNEDTTINDNNYVTQKTDDETIAEELNVGFGDEGKGDTQILEASSITQEEKNRRKRQIDYSNLPDAPSLPDFKMDTLPDYIKAILMEQSDHQTNQADNMVEDIEKKIKMLNKAVNHPPEEGRRKKEARTYGMSLAGDRGVVWNDVSAAHVTYHVGEPETITSTTLKVEVPDTTVRSTTTESKAEPIKDTTSDENKNGSSDESNDENLDSAEYKDIEASFDEIDKMLEELINESTSKPDDSENKDDESKITNSPIHSTTEMTTTESTTETTNKNWSSKDEHSTQKPKNEKPPHNSSRLDTAGKGNTDDKEEQNDMNDANNSGTKQKNEDSKQKQFVMELMKNKYFWQWLQDSSAAYLKVMIKKVDVLIKAEVESQIKQYFEKHKDDNSNCMLNNNSTSQHTIEKPNNTTDTDVEVISTTEKPLTNNTLEKPSATSNDADEVAVTTQNPIVNDSKLNERVKDDKPVNSDNGTQEELSKKHNNNESNNNDTPVKIEAQNVYGSSVGNGKVTNIFIFNISKESDLKNIKPLNNGTNGVFVFGVDDNQSSTAIPETTVHDEPKKDKTNPSNKEIHETNYEQSTPNGSNASDDHSEATIKPENDEKTTGTTEAIEVTTKSTKESKDLSKENTEKETAGPIDTSNATISPIDIEHKSTENSNKTNPTVNESNKDINGDQIKTTTEKKTNNDTTDGTNTTESIQTEKEKDNDTKDDTTHANDKKGGTNTTESTNKESSEVKDVDDKTKETETTTVKENNSKENEVDHNE